MTLRQFSGFLVLTGELYQYTCQLLKKNNNVVDVSYIFYPNRQRNCLVGSKLTHKKFDSVLTLIRSK